MTKCTCGFLPCICTLQVDSLELSLIENRNENKSHLRKLLDIGSMRQCIGCMLLPCICPSDGIHDDNQSSGCKEDEEEEEEEEEEDEYGRVRLLPIGNESEEKKMFIAKEIKKSLKTHQIEGIHFLHRQISQDKGCILADYMGLGKTLQVITALHSYMIDTKMEEKYKGRNSKVMILCPTICLANWSKEFKKWLSRESLDHYTIVTLDASSRTIDAKVQLVKTWNKNGGILLVGYELFRILLNPSTSVPISKREKSIQFCTKMVHEQVEEPQKMITCSALAEKASGRKIARDLEALLCDPGSDLIVLDEGHRMKDPTSLLCQSLMKVKTNKRIILTGYPVQNSLIEYWCMVNFAREGFLDTYDKFRAYYERPILEGDHQKTEELSNLLEKVVLRRGKALLAEQLPPKKEWVLCCKFSKAQYMLYCAFLESTYSNIGSGRDLFTAYATLLHVMNHPDLIYQRFCPANEKSNADLDKSTKDGDGWGWESMAKQEEKRALMEALEQKKQQKKAEQEQNYLWAREVLNGTHKFGSNDAKGYKADVIENSGKMAILMHIIEKSMVCGDKVVVFSQSVPTLSLIGNFLRHKTVEWAITDGKSVSVSGSTSKSRPKQTRSRDPAGLSRKKKNTNAAKRLKVNGLDDTNDWFLQIDGNTAGTKRSECIERFTSSDNHVKVLLVSTRAGAEGINLHAANRLVLFDVSWNPSYDHQSMCRSHRLGQSKTVHVYRLVSTGTMERMIYEQQRKKTSLSMALVDRSKSGLVTSDEGMILSGSGTEDSFFKQPDIKEVVTSSDGSRPIHDCEEIEDDPILVSCLASMGQWLGDIKRA
ncbi:unnamed protein product [Albugo candida]|nr:unnamed protein product [Albugo candida]|eukprot:CCI49978.1 unnamed protein product [Albugo candida]